MFQHRFAGMDASDENEDIFLSCTLDAPWKNADPRCPFVMFGQIIVFEGQKNEIPLSNSARSVTKKIITSL